MAQPVLQLTNVASCDWWKGVPQELPSPLHQSQLATLQQNVFLVTKISEEIFFVTKNTALVTKYEFRH